MQFIHCAAQDVASHLETPVDLILFHAVLEWVGRSPQCIAETLWSVLRPKWRVVVNVLQMRMVC